ncbi:hypothetical protein G5C51_17815 [Streptomyces sp. A7024]|uniref:DUF11 domain-containing protein n=1 Tax=Streptomyces coryli TaxID=1128680 RepID=A0A6G4U311_9ACTN|nr:hypothetical protein [Streptomyces coryli]NGN65748.1 hypothetical protein [Streptomyces coryli]
MTAGILTATAPAVMGASSSGAAPTIDIALSVAKDGGGNFTAEDGPGLDSGANNGIVRTHDTIQYKVDVNVTGGTARNETFTLDAPVGTEWQQLPGVCKGPGSKIDGQRLICNLGDLTNTSRSIPVLLRVTGDMKNGDKIPVSADVSADNAPGKGVAADPVTVSAAPKFDLDKKNGGIAKTEADGPNDEPGVVYEFPIVVDARAQDDPKHSPQLGSEPLASPFTFTDDISELLDGTSGGARLYDWGAVPACAPYPANKAASQPAGRGEGAKGVTESGTIDCTQSGAGANIDVTVTGADTSADHVPTQTTSGKALPADSAIVISGYIKVWIPQDAINQAAEGKPGGTVTIKNAFTGFDPKSISGQDNYGDGEEPLDNNTNTSSLVVNGKLLLRKWYESMDGDPVGTATDFETGDGYVTPGESFRSRVRVTNSGVTAFDPLYACDTFDNKLQTLTTDASGAYALTKNVSGVRIEYAAADWGSPREMQQADCNDDDGPWYDDPADVPGGVKAVGKVRFVGPLRGLTMGYYYTNLKVADGAEDGDRLRNFGMTRARQKWVHDTSDPEEALGRAADRVTVTSVLTRVNKKVVGPGETAETAPDRPSYQVTAGGTATYALYPTLTSKANGTGTHDVTVVDTLPEWISYAGSASVEPDSVEANEDGTTTVTWVLKDRKPNEPIDPITFKVRASSLAPETTAVNEVETSTPADNSPEDQRRATQALQIAHGAAMAIEKHAPVPVEKVGDDLTYDMTIANRSPRPLRNLDIIDALPYRGDGRSPASDFHGTVGLAKAPGPLHDGAKLFYTSAAPDAISLDPEDGSNDDGGATRWCEESELGETGCPASLAEVTGYRITDPGPLAPNETQSYDLVLATQGAVHDDVYTNRVGARASGLALPVQSGDANVRVIDEEDPGDPAEPSDDPTTPPPAEPSDEPTPDEPSDEPTPDDPSDEPTPDDPSDEPTPDEPSDEPTPDEPGNPPAPPAGPGNPPVEPAPSTSEPQPAPSVPDKDDPAIPDKDDNKPAPHGPQEPPHLADTGFNTNEYVIGGAILALTLGGAVTAVRLMRRQY